MFIIMNVLYVIVIVVLLLHQIDSFQYISKIKPLNLLSLSLTKSSITSLKDIPNIINNNINNCLCNVPTTSNNLKLIERPGYIYALGCDEWASSGYKGTMQTWNANKYIDWISTSHIIYNNDDNDDNNNEQISINIKEQIDISLFMTPDSNIPHITMTIASLPDSYTLHMDYIPRKEMISDLDYFDKYFNGLEKDINEMIISKSLVLSSSRLSILSQILRSPFALDLIIPLNDDSMTIILNLCENHLKRWSNWMLSVKDTTTDSDQIILYKRDCQLRKLQYDHMRFNFAQILGADFAPKAQEISVGMIGPSYSSIIEQS